MNLNGHGHILFNDNHIHECYQTACIATQRNGTYYYYFFKKKHSFAASNYTTRMLRYERAKF